MKYPADVVQLVASSDEDPWTLAAVTQEFVTRSWRRVR
jgi:hypothetical protein